MSTSPPPSDPRARAGTPGPTAADAAEADRGASDADQRPPGAPVGGSEDRAAELLALADWMTEEVAQQLYAARQDFADIAHEDDTKRADVEDVNAQLLLVIRSLHEVAGVLRAGASDARMAPSAQRLAEQVRATSATAHDLIAECLALVDHGLDLRSPPPD